MAGETYKDDSSDDERTYGGPPSQRDEKPWYKGKYRDTEEEPKSDLTQIDVPRPK